MAAPFALESRPAGCLQHGSVVGYGVCNSESICSRTAFVLRFQGFTRDVCKRPNAAERGFHVAAPFVLETRLCCDPRLIHGVIAACLRCLSSCLHGRAACSRTPPVLRFRIVARVACNVPALFVRVRTWLRLSCCSAFRWRFLASFAFIGVPLRVVVSRRVPWRPAFPVAR